MLESKPNLLAVATEIMTAYMRNNKVFREEFPHLIISVHNALHLLHEEPAPAPARLQRPATPIGKKKPAVPVNESVTPDYVICLEDGGKFRTLTRHLRSTYGMSPNEYREKWGLAADYPMNAPNFSKTLSKRAKKIQFWRPRNFGFGSED